MLDALALLSPAECDSGRTCVDGAVVDGVLPVDCPEPGLRARRVGFVGRRPAAAVTLAGSALCSPEREVSNLLLWSGMFVAVLVHILREALVYSCTHILHTCGCGIYRTSELGPPSRSQLGDWISQRHACMRSTSSMHISRDLSIEGCNQHT